ncbi:helix-turn-helix domain-containing protein [Ralstonia pseudosolanacearum]|uniref:helix-turn-helix domain-containing protein n=1 Tax=Ralstonia pseudosolanacearum TaxID=1310165 RepID=UPI001FFBF8D2|nr:helix-turn-helix transcriptional regulator [Ralstonia pseudosolanacearum]
MSALGDFVRQRRSNCDLTQADLARLVGVDATYINGIESGRKRPGGSQLLQALGDALQLDVAGRQELHRRADLSQRLLRLPEELSLEKSELVRSLIADLPHLETEGVDIIANVLAALRRQRDRTLMPTEPVQQGGAM